MAPSRTDFAKDVCCHVCWNLTAPYNCKSNKCHLKGLYNYIMKFIINMYLNPSACGCCLVLSCQPRAIVTSSFVYKIIMDLWYKIVTGLVCRVHNNCELPVGIYNICEWLVWVGRRCSARSSVDICDWHVYVFIGNSDTSLLLFLKCHIYKPVNSDGMF